MLLNKAWRASILSVLIMGSSSLSAQEAGVFSLDQVIHARVSGMKAPSVRAGIVSDKTILSSPSEKARMHVQQGFALIYAQWDFEAYRHFSAALQEDPDCLMAYAGVAFSLARPHGEYSPYREAAVKRMLDLVEVDDEEAKKGQLERFPKVEKKFAVATVNLVTAGSKAALGDFSEIREEFPNYTMAVLTHVFISRGGYDINGFATASQKAAVESATELLTANPTSPTMHSFLISLLASAPAQHTDFEKQVLPSARFLTENFPDLPSWHHALGHFSYRTGNYPEAEKAFRKSAELYTAWMKENAVSYDDCEGYVKVVCYLADTLYQRGDFDEAMKVAKELRALKVDNQRISSVGSQMLLWRAYTLPAQLYIARGNPGDMDLAHKSLPDRDELKPYLVDQEIPTFVGLYIEALSTYIGARKALDDSAVKAAKSIHRDRLTKNIKSMSSVLAIAKVTDEYSAYYEASRSIAIYDMELSGLIALKGSAADQVSASSWFRSAIDRQGFSSLMMPPSVITPMENRLAEYDLKKKDYKSAYENYDIALKKHPKSMPSLMGAKVALDKMGDIERAGSIQQQIDAVKR